MSGKAGVWIDHKKAVIVFLDGDQEEIKRIESDAEKHVRSSGGSRSKTPYGPQDVSAEDYRERKMTGHLGRYYDEVVSSLRDAESILIFGPGDAKSGLKEHLERHQLGGRIVGFETVDKMTDRQIAAKVRKHFIK